MGSKINIYYNKKLIGESGRYEIIKNIGQRNIISHDIELWVYQIKINRIYLEILPDVDILISDGYKTKILERYTIESVTDANYKKLTVEILRLAGNRVIESDKTIEQIELEWKLERILE